MRFNVLIFTLLWTSLLWGQLRIEGRYQGNNLYIQNPLNVNDGFCTDSIYLNGKRCNVATDNSAYEIDLRSMDLEIGEEIKIDIFHSIGCKPKVLSTHHHAVTPIELNEVRMNKNVLEWHIERGEVKLFYIEIYKWNKWLKVAQVDFVEGQTFYALDIEKYTHSGENIIRVSSHHGMGNKTVSDEVEYFSDQSAVTFKINQQTHFIQFSRKTMYELYDQMGNMVKKGYSDHINAENNVRGRYYLNYDNTNSAIKLK